MPDEEVTLDRLFRPVKPAEVGGRKLTIRALSGPEHSQRSLYATHQARKLEKDLGDPESDVYQYRIRPLDDYPVEDLKDVIRTNKSAEFRQEMVTAHPPVYRPFPEDATEDERRKILDLREEDEKKWNESIDRGVKDMIDAFFVSQVEGKDQVALLTMARKQTIDILRLAAANEAFAHYTLYRAVQAEDGGPMFDSAEDAGSISDSVVFYLYRIAQEVNAINPLRLNGQSSTD